MSTNLFNPTNTFPILRRPSTLPLHEAQDSRTEAKTNGSLPPELHRVLSQVESQKIGEIMQYLFSETTRLLSYLSLIETKLAKQSSPATILRTFNIIHKRAQSLFDYIENRALKTEGISDELRDALNFVSFALVHELDVVFNSLDDSDAGSSPANLENSCGHLSNCLQQSLVALAKVFNQNITLSEIFAVTISKREHALELRDDLTAIVVLLNEAEATCCQSSVDDLITELKDFQQRTLQYLYYSDREQCMSFITKISSVVNTSEFKPLLHQMKCYFETLLGHVGQRSSLNESASS